MAAPRDPMRRHFVVTLWHAADGGDFEVEKGYRDFSPEIESVIETARRCRAHYCSWSVEDAQLEAETVRKKDHPQGTHMHAYIECEVSIRWSTVVRRFQQVFRGAHIECRTGWRTTAREYNMGLRHGDEKDSTIISGEWGEWRPEDAGDQPDDIAQEAAQMIVDGLSPTEVARRFPRWYIRSGIGICRLWECLHRQRWLR